VKSATARPIRHQSPVKSQPVRAGRTFYRFRHESSGTSAIEFAMLAAPVILLLLAITEVGLVNFATFSLENGVTEAARLIRTGQAQTQGFNAAKFKVEVCKYISAPLNCAKVNVDVRKFANFSSAQLTSANADGSVNTSFNPGVGGDVVVVRAFYDWNVMAKLPRGVALSNMGNGDRMLTATVAFRNEPFKLP
jgi:Flp pilus assembly protein TadG